VVDRRVEKSRLTSKGMDPSSGSLEVKLEAVSLTVEPEVLKGSAKCILVVRLLDVGMVDGEDHSCLRWNLLRRSTLKESAE
jgi:hypothetical protein